MLNNFREVYKFPGASHLHAPQPLLSIVFFSQNSKATGFTDLEIGGR